MKSNVKKLWIGILILAIACLATIACVIGVKASNVVDESILNLEENADTVATPMRVPIPRLNKTSVEYNGYSQMADSSWFSTFFNGCTIRQGSSGNYVNVGTYSFTVSLPADDASVSYYWDDGTQTPKEYTFNIVQKTLSITPRISKTITYNGNLQSISSSDITLYTGYGGDYYNYANEMSFHGDMSGTLAGTYTVYATIMTGNVKWSQTTGRDLAFTWNINPKAVAKPTLVANQSFTYNGSSHTVRLNTYDTTLINVFGTLSATNAGTYTLVASLNNASNYAWSGGGNADLTLSWSIAPKTLTKPSIKSDLTYNGSQQTVQFNNFDTATMIVSGNTGTVAKSYTATISLKNTTNYVWSSGSNAYFTLSWKINPKSVAKPTLVTGQSFTYSGNSQTIRLNTYDTALINITGTLSATNAGTYSIVASLKDASNYAWSGGGNANVGLSWIISPKTLTKPSIKSNLTYNGSQQTVQFNNFDSATMSTSGNTGTGAGNYTATLSLKDKNNYVWSGGGTANFTLSWRIDPKGIAKPTLVANQSFIYNGNAQTINLNSYDTTAINITGNIQTNAGSYSVTASLKSTSNYKWTDNTTTSVSLRWTISPKTLTKPTVKSNLTYTGSEQTVAFNNFDATAMNVIGNTGTDAKTYTATISLKSATNYRWSGNTTTNVTLNWTISPKALAKPTITGSLTYNGNQQTISINGFDGATMNVSGNTGTDAKTYSATISLKSTTNYKWSDNTTANFALSWRIDPKAIAKPTLVANQSFTYNGASQTIRLNTYDTSAINITGISATNAGAYFVTASLKSTNYKWSDNTTSNFTLNWSIARKSVVQPTALADNVFVQNGSNLSYIPNGFDASQMDIQGNVQSEIGTYTASVTPNKNHMWSNGTTTAVTFDYIIIPLGITTRNNNSIDYIYNDNGIRKSYGVTYRHMLNDSELNIVNGETRYILGNIKAGTSIGDFLQSLQSDSSLLVIKDIKGNVLYDGLNNILDLNKLVATGYEVILYKDNTGAEVLDRVYLSVLGDLTGDGQINSMDMTMLNRILSHEIDITNFSLELQLATMLNNNGMLSSIDREIMHNIVRDIDENENYFGNKEITSDYVIFELNGNTRVNKTLTTSSLVQGAVVGNISQGTTTNEFVSKMQSQGINISLSDMYKANNASLGENDIVGTGCYFTYNGNKIYLTILGDLTGDGRVNSQDRLVINKVVSGGKKFDDMITAVKLACLINNNGAVTSTDSEIVWQSIIGEVVINNYI